MQLRAALDKNQLERIEKLYLEAFPKIERKPFDMILKKREEDVVELLSIENDEGEFRGLAITARYEDMVLLDYFAIDTLQRGQGVGSAALRLLQNYYADKRFILEIERTDIEADNIEQRLKRKAFYLKNGMKLMPFLVNIFGTEMEVLTHECEVTFEEYRKLYEVFGKELERKVMLIGVRDTE